MKEGRKEEEMAGRENERKVREEKKGKAEITVCHGGHGHFLPVPKDALELSASEKASVATIFGLQVVFLLLFSFFLSFLFAF